MCGFSDLVGKTLVSIDVGEEKIRLETNDGVAYQMFHSQDCCEYVYVESVVGDTSDVLHSPILKATESSNSDDAPLGDYDESYTWTFYTLSTIKGTIDIRWYGTSNGYYSESVTFTKDAA